MSIATFPKTTVDALLPNSGWEDDREKRECAEMFGEQLASTLAKSLRNARPLPSGIRVRRSFCLAHSLFKLLWKALGEEEKIKEPGKARARTYEAHIGSMTRLGQLFGSSPLIKHFKAGSSIIIAPQAFATCNVTGQKIGEDQAPPEHPRLVLHRGEIIAVLQELGGGLAWGISFEGNVRASILGRNVRGQMGIFPLASVRYTVPFTINYSPKTKRVRLSFSYLAFNAGGHHLGTHSNDAFVLAFFQAAQHGQQ